MGNGKTGYFWRMGWAGLPAAMASAGISPVTTELAPITALSPIFTPLSRVLFAPMKTPFPMEMGETRTGFSEPRGISCMSESHTREPAPMREDDPIVIFSKAMILDEEIPQFACRSIVAEGPAKRTVRRPSLWEFDQEAALMVTVGPIEILAPCLRTIRGKP